MTEDELKAAVLDLCELLGLFVHHCRPAMTGKGWRTPIEGDAGFPDLVIVGHNGVLFRELKSDKKKPTLLQEMWLLRLGKSGADADVWRPADLQSGRVLRELEGIR